MADKYERPNDLNALIEYSTRIGSEPLLIQSAGGNTSVKDGEVMWIKASGTLLAEANTKDIFVAVDLPKMRAALTSGDPRSDQPAEFTISKGALRPSIETSLHAVFRQRVVIHVHCIQTLAHAIRTDCEALISQKLSDFDWCMVPYTKPGANLAREVMDKLTDDTNVVILANHGLLIAADSVEDAEQLLLDVVSALTVEPSIISKPDTAALKAVRSDVYEVADDNHVAHQLALDPERTKQVTAGSLYPDHVIFCGVGAMAMGISEVEALPPDTAPVFIIVPNHGVLIRKDASEGAHALVRCLADLMLRVPTDAELNYLSEEQNYELIDWDAEKYRQQMNAQ